MARLHVIDAMNQTVDEAEVTSGKNLAQGIVESFPEGFGDVIVFVMSPEMEVIEPGDVYKHVLGEAETYTLAIRPLEPVSIFLAGSALFGLTTVGGLIVAGLALAATFLMKPSLPSVTPQQSYNWDNSDDPQFFSAQSNRLRIGARVPDVFGRMRVWPDLIVEPWSTYSGAEQETHELYVVSNGVCDITDAFVHDEITESMVNTDYRVFQPGGGQTWPTQDEMPIYQTNQYVQNINLSGPNDAAALTVEFSFNTAGYIEADVANYFTSFKSFVGKWVFVSNSGHTNNNTLYYISSITNNDQRLNVSPAPGTTSSGRSPTLRGITDCATTNGSTPRVYNTGSSWQIYYKSDPNDIMNPSAVVIDRWVGPEGMARPDFIPTGAGSATAKKTSDNFEEKTYNWRGSYSGKDQFGNWRPTVNNIFSSTVTNTRGIGNAWFLKKASSNYQPDVPGTGLTTSVFQVPGVINRIEADFEFPEGLYQQKANQGPALRNVTVRMYYRLSGTEDAWQTVDWSMGADVRGVRRFTRSLDVAVGEWEVYFQRTTTEVANDGTFVAIDTTQLIGLRGRQEFSAELLADEIECTLVLLTMKSTNMSQLNTTRSFNVIAERVLPDNSYDGDLDRAHQFSAEQCILYSLIDQAGYDPNMIDREGLAAIQADMNSLSVGVGFYNAIHDQTNTVEDQVRSMCGPGRIGVYRRGAKVYFYRLKQGMVPTRLITNRNKTEAEQRTMNFGDANDATSVILRFLDAANGWEEAEVQYPDPATNPGADINPEEQSVLGITDKPTALAAAQYIWDQKHNERDTASVQMHMDGLLLSPGEVVAMTDALEPNSVALDGQIRDIAGTVWNFGQPIPAGTYSLRITGANGEVVHSDLNLTVSSQTMTIDLGVAAPVTVPDAAASVGLRWAMIEVNDDEYSLFYVKDVKPSRDGPTAVELAAYRQETYQSDTLVITGTEVPSAQKRRGAR